jgi:flagellar FliL protein
MKLALIALGALIILGGGAAGAYFYFAKPAEAAAGEISEADKAHDAAKKAAHDAGPSTVKFVQLDAMILPIIDDSGVTQTVSLVVAIEVADDVEEANVKLLAPRLKDAYIQDMYGMLNRKASMEGGVIQAAKLKDRLNKVTAKVLGQDQFNDVLLQVVNQRPI